MKRNATPYDILDLEQGSQEWKDARFDYVTASQIPVLFDLCPYQSREELLKEKIARKEREISDFKKVLFERGHKAEAVCRDWVKKEWQLDIEPVVLVSRKVKGLLASLDGYSSEHKIVFEAKHMGAKALEDVSKGIIKPNHMCQVQAQLVVTGADKCIYFALDEQGRAATTEIRPDAVYKKYIGELVSQFMADLNTAKGVTNAEI